MRLIDIDPILGNRRLRKIAIDEKNVYLMADRKSHNKVQLWRVNAEESSEWTCLFELQLHELIYTVPAYDHRQKVLYLLVVGVFPNESFFRVEVIRCDGNGKEIKKWELEDRNGEIFWSMPLENAVMGVGWEESNPNPTIHIYDRSIVEGPIQFFYIHLLENTFSMERKFLDAPDELRCHRFAICLNGQKRRFARLCPDNGIVVYDDASGQWVRYRQTKDTEFDLQNLQAVKQLRETYGREGRRVGAVESPFTIYADNGVCVAKRVSFNGEHLFYLFCFSHTKREYKLKYMGSANLTNIATMYYALVNKAMAVIIGLNCIAIVPFEVPPLTELALWSVQETLSPKAENEVNPGEVEGNELRKLFDYYRAHKYN